ncbi:IclR family transcriptional regulator [Geobacter argillaceus]|uniref:IclR family transcriptional regulator n=1 Tax=Geobacter argillaceus TaxID=345631 RepID=A0A562VMV5_9BACT|nr:IclR family transcriptional regulator [Geobacter argillaceus]TWJ19239.1 IclR family transcriptional regulator [Geobacter argillaceus]
MFRDKREYTVQSVENALDILEVLAEGTLDATLPRLSETLGVSRNKVFRLLATLESRELVQREEQSGVYRLGLGMLGLAQRVVNGASLIRHAHPVMETLARKHDEAVYLTVLQGEEVLFLDMVDCDQPVKAAALVGKKYPFFTNAAGKAIKALEPGDLLEKFFKKVRRRMDADEVARLESELSEIREKGVAIDSGGLGEGIVGVAVAVRDYAGKVVGAITLLGPSFRLLTDRIENEIVPSLMEGAETLSMKFGYARV